MTHIRLLYSGMNVTPLITALTRQPWLWNQHTFRTENPASPHRAVDDIWLRYNDYANRNKTDFHGPHESLWYPAYYALPQVRDLVFPLMAAVEGERLGGVLITRIPAGCRVEPHVDGGWHASYYDKYAIQLMGNERQAFQFEGQSLSAKPGDVYWLDNSKTHWVTNDSDEDRMTLIVCIRSDRQQKGA